MVVKTPAPERAAGRRKLAKKKQALPDGSFPIPNVSYLKKAIRAVGRAAAGKRPALARLIRKRGRELGSRGMAVVKGSWADNAQSAKAMANALRAELLEFRNDPAWVELELSQTIPLLLADVTEFTRHVRTPAGVKRYHKPVGSPIGKGGGPDYTGAIKKMKAAGAESREHAKRIGLPVPKPGTVQEISGKGRRGVSETESGHGWSGTSPSGETKFFQGPNAEGQARSHARGHNFEGLRDSGALSTQPKRGDTEQGISVGGGSDTARNRSWQARKDAYVKEHGLTQTPEERRTGWATDPKTGRPVNVADATYQWPSREAPEAAFPPKRRTGSVTSPLSDTDAEGNRQAKAAKRALADFPRSKSSATGGRTSFTPGVTVTSAAYAGHPWAQVDYRDDNWQDSSPAAMAKRNAELDKYAKRLRAKGFVVEKRNYFEDGTGSPFLLVHKPRVSNRQRVNESIEKAFVDRSNKKKLTPAQQDVYDEARQSGMTGQQARLEAEAHGSPSVGQAKFEAGLKRMRGLSTPGTSMKIGKATVTRTRTGWNVEINGNTRHYAKYPDDALRAAFSGKHRGSSESAAGGTSLRPRGRSEVTGRPRREAVSPKKVTTGQWRGGVTPVEAQSRRMAEVKALTPAQRKIYRSLREQGYLHGQALARAKASGGGAKLASERVAIEFSNADMTDNERTEFEEFLDYGEQRDYEAAREKGYAHEEAMQIAHAGGNEARAGVTVRG